MKKQPFKKNITTPLLVLIIFLTSSISYSQDQKADIIFKDGTILDGYAMVTKRDKVKFRLTLEEKPDTWDYKMLKGVVFYGFHIRQEYEYIQLNRKQKPFLVKVEEREAINLYSSQSFANFSNFIFGKNGGVERIPNFSKSSTLYVKRENENFAKILAGNFKKRFRDYIKNCKEVLELIDSDDYRKYSNRELIEEYNIYCSE